MLLPFLATCMNNWSWYGLYWPSYHLAWINFKSMLWRFANFIILNCLNLLQREKYATYKRSHTCSVHVSAIFLHLIQRGKHYWYSRCAPIMDGVPIWWIDFYKWWGFHGWKCTFGSRGLWGGIEVTMFVIPALPSPLLFFLFATSPIAA